MKIICFVYRKLESGAGVAASQEFLKAYVNVTSSKEYRAATPSFSSNFHIPKSGLTDSDIDDLVKDFPCAGKYETCKEREVTDDDVKELFKSSKKSIESQEVSLDQSDFENDFSSPSQLQHRTDHQKASTSTLKNDAPISIVYSSRVMYKSPPRKIAAHGTLKPVSSKSKESNNLSYVDQIKKSWEKSSTPPPPQVEIKNPAHSSQHSKVQSATPAVVEPTTNPYIGFKPSRALLTQKVKTNEAASTKSSVNAAGSSNYQPVKPTGGKLRFGLNAPYKVPTQQPSAEPMVEDEELEHPLLKGVDPKLLEIIKNDVIDCSKDISWNDIAGLKMAKETLREAVVLPLLRPDLFHGLRAAPKGILLFGPPGTGKTLIGKCIAAQAKATFFSVSASTLTSKWIGEGEKLVRALFLYARAKQPSVIFLDEIDSILSKRSSTEHESSRRLKTEFLIQLEGAHTTTEKDQLLLVGATNRPQEIDDAARRRFTKRLYIPLPESDARRELLVNLMKKNRNCLSDDDLAEIAEAADGFSGADMKSLCSEASFVGMRELSESQIIEVEAQQIRPIDVNDFRKSLQRVKPTVSQSDLQQYIEWNNQFGSTA